MREKGETKRTRERSIQHNIGSQLTRSAPTHLQNCAHCFSIVTICSPPGVVALWCGSLNCLAQPRRQHKCLKFLEGTSQTWFEMPGTCWTKPGLYSAFPKSNENSLAIRVNLLDLDFNFENKTKAPTLSPLMANLARSPCQNFDHKRSAIKPVGTSRICRFSHPLGDNSKISTSHFETGMLKLLSELSLNLEGGTHAIWTSIPRDEYLRAFSQKVVQTVHKCDICVLFP